MRKTGQKLGLKQSQNVMMTPQMQLAMRVLSLGQLELSALIQEKIEENPLLEIADTEGQEADVRDEGGSERAVREADLPADLSTDLSEADAWHEDFDIDHAINYGDERLLRDNGLSAATVPNEPRLVKPMTLADDLSQQIIEFLGQGPERQAALELVHWLDDDGYLRESDEEIAAHMQSDSATILAARQALQQCQPRGLAARDLQQCLRLQLNDSSPELDLVLTHLPELARLPLAEFATALELSVSTIKQCVHTIRTLDPHPGRHYEADPALSAPPDLIIRRIGQEEWRAEVNETFLPAVQIREDYWQDLARMDKKEELTKYLTQNRQAARWLQRTIFTRGMSLLRIGEAIIEHQKPFLQFGPKHLQPMTMRELAERLGMNEGTVSRLVANKLIETPNGLWTMKALFTAPVGHDSGGEGSSAGAVREKIKSIIDQEDPQKPLSDDKIVAILAEEKLTIARRTVTKYREALGLGSSVERRRQKQFS